MEQLNSIQTIPPEKDDFEPLPDADRSNARLVPGKDLFFRISTSHEECFLDMGNGLINSSERVNTRYLILECPKVPAANGLFIEPEEIILESMLVPAGAAD